MVTALLRTLPAGPAVTPATLKMMAALVRKYRREESLINAARLLTQNVAERDARGAIGTLQTWVRDNIKYVEDPRDLELVQTPVQTLKMRTGDCDDKSVLIATLLETLGFTTRFCAVAMNGDTAFTHVMAQVRLGNGWLNLETILPGIPAGWFPPNVSRCYFWRV